MSELKKYYLCDKRYLIGILSLYLLNAICDVAISVMIYALVDIVSGDEEMMNFIYAGIIDLAVLFLIFFVYYFVSYLTHRYVNIMTEKLRMDVFENILDSDFEQLNQQSAGEYLAILQKDISSISDDHFSAFFDIISHIFTLVLAVMSPFYSIG